ncbi:hypothetical protein IC607_10335 [Cellulomonas sp. JH27-2]|uniref:hypothetical protein n=1 Tax=Cellulomonas sp. JH27-2 TaxID=2774139 RepID=UPI00177F475F|nr:hypothetical protein [Cellulomonas sp. JH27-2]MBD8059364.1 hypothetical protein [Cellulomonas sp. JH27-2]
MTTFEDLDLADAFGDDFSSQEQPVRRRRGLISAIVLVVAVLLLGGGLVYLATASTSSSTVADIAAGEAAPALDSPQGAVDLVSQVGLDGTGITSASTRYLADTDLGRVYLGTSTNGKVCLLAVPTGDLPTTECAKPRTDTVLVLRPDDDGPGVAYVTGDGEAPAKADGWHQTQPGLWVVAGS